MMRGPRKIVDAKLKEDLQQKWVINSYQRTYTDQFGFTISYGTKIRLNYRERWQIELQSIAAAKLISSIFLNDYVMNSKDV